MLKQDSILGLSLDIKLDGLSRNPTHLGKTISSYLLKHTLFYDSTMVRFPMPSSTKYAGIVKGHITLTTLNHQTHKQKDLAPIVI